MARVLEFFYSLFFLAIGIASLVTTILHGRPADCGLNASPPISDWLYGSGIAYIIISVIFLASGIYFAYGSRHNFTSHHGISNSIVIAMCLFMLAWSIVGSVSLWKQGTDCEITNPAIWQMGFAGVTISILLTSVLLIHCILTADR
jgi:hypothetical protein